MTATYLINRLPTSALDFQVPYTKLLGAQPDYSFLHVFGCACFPHLRPFNKHKMEFRSTECVFLGYSTMHKGYKCLTPDEKIIISKDVIFNESAFPYSKLFTISTNQHAESVPLPPAPLFSDSHLSSDQYSSQGQSTSLSSPSSHQPTTQPSSPS